MKYYIAGPMTGIPQFNYPLFDEVATVLRGRGYDIVSPAEMDDDETRAEAMASEDGILVDGHCNSETWGDFLSRDVKIVADEVQGIMLLPGWQNSRGARLEAFVALGCGHDLKRYYKGVISKATPEYVMGQINEGVLGE